MWALVEEISMRRHVDWVYEFYKRTRLDHAHPMAGKIDLHADTRTKASIYHFLRRFDVPVEGLEEILQEQRRALQAPIDLAVGSWVECYARAPLDQDFGAYIGVGIVSSPPHGQAAGGVGVRVGLLDKSIDPVWQRWQIDNVAFKQQIEVDKVCCKPLDPVDVAADMSRRLKTLTKRFNAEENFNRVNFPDG